MTPDILLFNSVSGGTGSGFSSLLMDRLNDDYEKLHSLNFVVYPETRGESIVVAPYNSICAHYFMLANTSLTVYFNNRTMAKDKLSVNSIVAKYAKILTYPLR